MTTRRRYLGVVIICLVALLLACMLGLGFMQYALHQGWVPPTRAYALGQARIWSNVSCADGEVENGMFVCVSKRSRWSLSVAIDNVTALTLLSYDLEDDTP